MIDDDFTDVLSLDAVKRAAAAFKQPTPFDSLNKARLAVIATGLPEKLRRAEGWVEDLTEYRSGMYVRCSYCGEKAELRRGEANRTEWMKKHILHCPKHPLAEAKREIERLKAIISERSPLATD